MRKSGRARASTAKQPQESRHADSQPDDHYTCVRQPQPPPLPCASYGEYKLQSCRKLLTRPAKSINDPQAGFFINAPANSITGAPCQQQRASRDNPGRLLIFAPQTALLHPWLSSPVQGQPASQQVAPSARATIDQNSASAQETFTTKAQTNWLCC